MILKNPKSSRAIIQRVLAELHTGLNRQNGVPLHLAGPNLQFMTPLYALEQLIDEEIISGLRAPLQRYLQTEVRKCM